MSIPSKQIGWSNESNLLWQIAKQLERLTGVTSKISGGGSPYLKYVALLSQSGTDAPVATVLENTLGVTITYSREDTGEYLLTASDNIFLQDKTWAVANTPSYDGNGPFALQIGRISDSQCHIYSYQLSVGLTDLGTNSDRTSIEIRVYP